MGAVRNKFDFVRHSKLINRRGHCKAKVLHIAVVVLYLEQVLVDLWIKRLQVVKLV